jgi:hypothetical protein
MMDMTDPDRALELVPFAEARPRTFNELLCDGATARNLASFADLLDLHARLQAERPGVRVIATLDDLGQACYTSGHGSNYHKLDDLKGHDLSGLGEEVFENGEHRGYLSTPAEFPIRLANLRRLSVHVGLDQVAGVLDWGTPEDANDLISINSDPDAALRISDEDRILFLYAPVDTGADALAAFPNGYFGSDLNPMQNYALARHLEEQFGLTLFGIGSRFIGFRRAETLVGSTVRELAAALVALYSGSTQTMAQELERLIAGRSWVLLRYTEE